MGYESRYFDSASMRFRLISWRPFISLPFVRELLDELYYRYRSSVCAGLVLGPRSELLIGRIRQGHSGRRLGFRAR